MSFSSTSTTYELELTELSVMECQEQSIPEEYRQWNLIASFEDLSQLPLMIVDENHFGERNLTTNVEDIRSVECKLSWHVLHLLPEDFPLRLITQTEYEIPKVPPFGKFAWLPPRKCRSLWRRLLSLILCIPI